MPSRHAIATADAEVRNRIRLATNRLVRRLGLDEPQAPAFERNPDFQRIRELEAHADFLESLDASLKDEGYTAAAGESLADQKAEADDAATAPDSATAPAKTTKAAPKTTKVKA